jgi:hypothetical protein
MNTAFISGHINILDTEFNKYYSNELDNTINQNQNFVIGNSDGADYMALHYLLKKGINPKNITIYYYVKYPNNNTRSEEYYQNLGVNVITGFTSYTQRDKSMTLASDYDIAWIRSLEESKMLYGDDFNFDKKSGTQLNLERRVQLKKLQLKFKNKD